MKAITTRPETARTGWPYPPAPQHAHRLPDLCQCGGLHSRICERGTKGCTCQHELADQPSDRAAIDEGAKT